MIKRMNGIKKEYGYPVLVGNGSTAVSDEVKADMLAHTFVKVHSSNNISEEGKRGREVTITENEALLQMNEDSNDLLNIPFTMAELNGMFRRKQRKASKLSDRI